MADNQTSKIKTKCRTLSHTPPSGNKKSKDSTPQVCRKKLKNLVIIMTATMPFSVRVNAKPGYIKNVWACQQNYMIH